MSKSILCGILTLCFLGLGVNTTCFGQNQLAKNNFEVYLLIGQSNMSGRGKILKERKVQSNILALNKNQEWDVAKDPIHFDRDYAGVGPGISFAKEMQKENESVTIGLIPCAWGGSPIRVWKSGVKYFKNYPYDEAIERAKIAMQKGRLKGVLWHQGESNNTQDKSRTYLEHLKKLVSNLRKDLNAPNLPFIAGEIGRFNKGDYINNIINKLPNEVENTAVVSSLGLSDRGDQLHFNSNSIQELGKRYAVAMKKLQNNTTNKKPTVVLTFDDAEISHYVNVAPILLEYGYDATFFVCEFPIRKPEEKKEYMDWNQIFALHKMGFEIGNHTGHHKNVTKLSREDMIKEVSYIDEKCMEYSIPKPISFAYPGNRCDSISQEILKEMGYQYARAGGSRLYNAKEDSKLAVPGYTVASTEKLTKRVNKALKKLKPGEIMVLTMHGIPDIIHPDYSTSIKHLKSILEYIKKHDFKVISMKNLKHI